jgi:hypothetical protein
MNGFLTPFLDNRSELAIEAPISDLWPAILIAPVHLRLRVIAWYLYALSVAEFGYVGF